MKKNFNPYFDERIIKTILFDTFFASNSNLSSHDHFSVYNGCDFFVRSTQHHEWQRSKFFFCRNVVIDIQCVLTFCKLSIYIIKMIWAITDAPMPPNGNSMDSKGNYNGNQWQILHFGNTKMKHQKKMDNSFIFASYFCMQLIIGLLLEILYYDLIL